MDEINMGGARRRESGMSALAALGLEERNAAGYGAGSWLTAGRSFTSHNPANGMPIAQVGACSIEQYETVVAAARAACAAWQAVPAPRRGELVGASATRCARTRRRSGALVTLETGKIRAEGEGEVQEMIDICDFAVGLSRSSTA